MLRERSAFKPFPSFYSDRLLATNLLREGCSLDEIGELLRHQSPDTTAIYAKVDLVALRTLALPWPGGGR